MRYPSVFCTIVFIGCAIAPKNREASSGILRKRQNTQPAENFRIRGSVFAIETAT